MKFETYLLLIALIIGIFATNRAVRRSESPQERFFAIRVSAFIWIIGLVLLVVFLSLSRVTHQIIFLVPVFVIVVTLVKFWQNARARLRRERQERVDLERMKRVN